MKERDRATSEASDPTGVRPLLQALLRDVPWIHRVVQVCTSPIRPPPYFHSNEKLIELFN